MTAQEAMAHKWFDPVREEITQEMNRKKRLSSSHEDASKKIHIQSE